MKISIKHFLLPVTALIGNMSTTDVSAQSAISLQEIAAIGGTAPGTGGNTWSAIPSNAYISSTNTVCFEATAGASGNGIWHGAAGSYNLGALNGQPAPGAGGANFITGGFTGAAMPTNSGGGASFISLGGAPATTGIWSFSGGVTTLRALLGDFAPDEAGVATAQTFTILFAPSYNDAGNYVFTSWTSGSPNRMIHADVGSGLVRAIMSGAAGTPTGIPTNPTYTTFDTTNGLVINDNNRICFTASFSGTAATNAAIQTTSVPVPVTGPTLVAQKGTVAAGTAFNYLAFTGSQFNNNEDVVYRATLDATAPVDANTGLWHYDDTTSTRTLISRENDPAPGTANFFGSYEEWFAPDNGSIAFVADTRDALGNSQGRGVWIDPDGPGLLPLSLVAANGLTALGKDGVTPIPAVTITNITQVSMNRNGDLLLRMILSDNKDGLWIRPQGNSTVATLFLLRGSSVYDTERNKRVVSLITCPEAIGFTSLGGGPIGRPNVLSESAEPLTVLSLDSSAAGLFLPTSSPLTFVVASSDDDAPGPGGNRFQSLRSSGAINENGLSASRGFLEDAVGDTVAGLNSQGIWAEVPDTSGPILTLVARQGDAAPGGGVFGQLPYNPIYNDNNEVAFNADGGLGASGLWKGVPGALSLVQAQGEPNIAVLPGGQTFGFMRTLFAFNNAGRIATFLPLTIGSGSPAVTIANDTVLVRLGTSPKLIAREGDLAGTGNAKFDDFRVNKAPNLNNNSNSVFSARRKISVPDGVDATNQWGIWYHNGTSRSVVAAGSIPASPQNVSGHSGVQFLKPENPALNDGNRIAFYSTLTGTSVSSNVDDVGLFLSNAAATPTMLVRTGQKQSTGFGPSGINADAEFVGLSSPIIGAIGSTPQVLYRANMLVGAGGVAASNDTALWVHNGTTSRLVAREGSFTPDQSGVATTTVWNTFDHFTISPTGRVAFTATQLVGTGGVTSSDDYGLWAETSNGSVVLVVREGTNYDIPTAGGGTRTVTVRSIILSGALPYAGAGLWKSFNSNGFLVAHMTYTDGTTGSLVFLVP